MIAVFLLDRSQLEGCWPSWLLNLKFMWTSVALANQPQGTARKFCFSWLGKRSIPETYVTCSQIITEIRNL